MNLIINTGRKMIPLMVLVIVLVAGLIIFFNTTMITERVKATLVEIVREQLGEEIQIGKITLFPLNRVTVHQVKLMDGEKPLIQADRVAVSFSLSDLVKGTEGIAKSIKEIHLYKPEVNLIKGPNGFEFEKYLTTKEQGQQSKLEFSPVIRISDGRVNYQDDQVDERLEALNGAVRMKQDGITLELSGKVKGIGVPVWVKGSVTPKINLAMTVTDLPFDAVERYGLQPKELKSIGGKGTGSVQIAQNAKGGWNFSGNLTVVNANVAVDQVPTAMDQLNGQFTFDQEHVEIHELRGRTAAGRIAVKGEVRKFSDPTFSLTLTSGAIDLKTVASWVPQLAKVKPLPTGQVAASIDIQGRWKDPLVKGTFRVPELGYGKLKVHQFFADLRYQDRFVTINKIQLPLDQGKINGYGGYISLKEKDGPVYSINADVENINIRHLVTQLPVPLALPEVPGGLLNGKVYFSGVGFNPNTMTAIGYLDITKGGFYGMPFDRAQANFWFAEGVLGLSKAELVAPYAKTSFTGQIDLNGDVDLVLEPSNVDASWLGKKFNLPVKGKGTLQGDIKGSLKKPYFLGKVAFDQGSAWNQPFDTLTANLRVDPEKLDLSRVTLVKGKTKLTVTGTVGLARQDLNLQAEVLHSSFSDLQATLDFMKLPFDITGDITGAVTLAGPWKNLQVEGNVSATQGVVLNQPYDRAQLAFRWKDRDVILNDFTVAYQNTVLHAAGRIDDYKDLQIEMDGQGFDLTDIAQLRTTVLDLRGKANFRGTLTGTLESPSFWGTIASDQITYNGVPIEQVSALLQYYDNVLRIKPAKVVQGAGDYTLLGEVRFDEQTLEMQIRPRQVKITDLLRYVDLPVKVIDYALDGEIWVRGEFSRPRVEIDAQLADGKKGSLVVNGVYEMDKGMNIYLKGDQFDLSQFKSYVKIQDFNYTLNGEAIVQGHLTDPHMNVDVVLKDGGRGTLAVSGAYNLRGGLDLRLKGQEFDLRPFKPYLPIQQDYTGKLNVEGKVAGPIEDLDAALNVEIVDGSFNQYRVQYLGGEVKIHDSTTITLDQRLALPDGNEVHVNGTLPIQDKHGPLNLNIEMNKGNLEILALFLPDIEQAGGGGSGAVKIKGTLAQPVIEGELNIAKGLVKYKGLDLIRDITSRISLNKGRIDVEELKARYGKGTVSVQGNIKLDGFMPSQFNLGVKSKDFHFVYGSIDAFGDADLKVTGSLTEPEIRGPILVHNAAVGVIPFVWPTPKPKPAHAKTGGQSSGLKINPKFYLELRPGDNVHVTGASPINLNVTVLKNSNDILVNDPTNTLVIDNTSGELILSGELASRNGTFNFYNANFRVIRASASFVKVNKSLPILHIQSQTILGKYKVYLDVDGIPQANTGLKLTLTSEPPLSEKEIMSLLAKQGGLGDFLEGSGNVTEMISDEIWRFINQGLRNEFLNKLENSVERALHLDTFQVDPILFGDTKLNVQVGKYVSDKLYIVYNQTFAQEPEQSIGFEYHINRAINLEGIYKGPGDFQVGLNASFQF